MAKLRLREMHLLRVRKTVNVSGWGLPCTLQAAGTWSMLWERRSVQVGAAVGEVVVYHCLGAVKARVLRVGRANAVRALPGMRPGTLVSAEGSHA